MIPSTELTLRPFDSAQGGELVEPRAQGDPDPFDFAQGHGEEDRTMSLSNGSGSWSFDHSTGSWPRGRSRGEPQDAELNRSVRKIEP